MHTICPQCGESAVVASRAPDGIMNIVCVSCEKGDVDRRGETPPANVVKLIMPNRGGVRKS